MKKCKRCGAVVRGDPLAQFEHTLFRHGMELMRDPARLLAVARDPAAKRLLMEDLKRRAAHKLAGLLLLGSGK